MRLIGLKIERMDPAIQKVLNPGWYPFGNYEEPKTSGFLYVPSVSHTERNLYWVRNNQPKVSVSCVVGMNGSGKSTIIEIIYRILNNLAVRQCEGIGSLVGTDMEYAYGVYADLYCEVDHFVRLIRCRNNDVTCYRYREGSQEHRLLEETGTPAKVLSRLFYTIGVNYSLYAYDGSSYQSKQFDQINGEWLQGVFHKNDGYRAPITLVPFREKGEISMEKENELAIQRITALSILSRAKDRQFPEGYYPDMLHYKLNREYKEKKMPRFRNNYQPKCSWMDVGNLVEKFEVAWQNLIEGKHIPIVLDRESDEYKLALFYIAYKAAKISFTYDDYFQAMGFDNGGPIEDLEDRCMAVVDMLHQRPNDHITLKIHQTLSYMQGSPWFENGDHSVEQLLAPHRPETYDEVVKLLPPPFYDLDLTFVKAKRKKGRWRSEGIWDSSAGWSDDKGRSFQLSSMSSGERQVLVAISYVLYHLKNLQSVEDSNFRVLYHHVCLVFDEVELYFHPDYQRRFLSMLIESLSWTKIDRRKIRSIHILIATHSPFILTDVLTERTLYLKEGRREIVEAQTFGGNYYDLLDNSFFFQTTAIGEISARATRRWIKRHDENLRPVTEEEMAMVGDPFVRDYLKIDHSNNQEEDVQG